MHGFNNGLIMAKCMCEDYDIIMLQEQCRGNVSKRGEVDSDLIFFGCLV